MKIDSSARNVKLVNCMNEGLLVATANSDNKLILASKPIGDLFGLDLRKQVNGADVVSITQKDLERPALKLFGQLVRQGLIENVKKFNSNDSNATNV